MLLGWESGATALLSCSIVGHHPTAATVIGTESRIDLPRDFFRPDHFVLHRPGKEPEDGHLGARSEGLSGMQYEAAEVMRALRAGETESPLVPLEGTLAVMRTLDAVRDRTGVRYPADS
ncbi:Gfo/Idh/MocA family oxidoreductase OS=Streptomyces cyaneofuscatus OX=66883 GN=G3I52_05935 PE=3 SV=1 [Streptomyces cyaneofuscatus]